MPYSDATEQRDASMEDNVDPAHERPELPARQAERRQLPDEVAAYVRELIITGRVRPGEFLRIERIAEAIGVSQTPVREGLLSLKSEGLVNLLPRRGFIVAPITPQDISDSYWVQAQLYGELAARAAELITPAQLKILSANIKQYAAAVAGGDWESLPELGTAFHREVNRAADAHRLVLILDLVATNLPTKMYGLGNPKQTGRDHPEIVKALRKRDADRARRLMTDHILDQGARLIQTMTDRGFWAADHDTGKSK